MLSFSLCHQQARALVARAFQHTVKVLQDNKEKLHKVRLCVCVHACVCACVHVCVSVYLHAHVCMCVCLHVFLFVLLLLCSFVVVVEWVILMGRLEALLVTQSSWLVIMEWTYERYISCSSLYLFFQSLSYFHFTAGHDFVGERSDVLWRNWDTHWTPAARKEEDDRAPWLGGNHAKQQRCPPSQTTPETPKKIGVTRTAPVNMIHLECKAAWAERGWWCGCMSSLFLAYFFISRFLPTSFMSATVLFSPTRSVYNFSLHSVTFGHAALLGPSCRGQCLGKHSVVIGPVPYGLITDWPVFGPVKRWAFSLSCPGQSLDKMTWSSLVRRQWLLQLTLSVTLMWNRQKKVQWLENTYLTL